MASPKTLVSGKGFSKKDAKKFDWSLFPKAEKFLQQQLKAFTKKNAKAASLGKAMQKHTSTRLFDWVDHMVLPVSFEKKIRSLGFSPYRTDAQSYSVEHSILFPIVLTEDHHVEVVLKPEVLARFTQKHAHGTKISGKKFARLRKAVIHHEKSTTLSAIERRGYNGFLVAKDCFDRDLYKQCLEAFKTRKRTFRSDKQGMEYTKTLVSKWVKQLDSARVADAFFRAERHYWQKRNKAGQVQKKRQDSLGLGWGNHDHHTYRSSRACFTTLVQIMETLGFECRERFYAGEKAGWGAQVMEHPSCDIVLFCDADMTAKDRHTDFAHKGFVKNNHFGTVGLWVALHGESILQAGMHHLEARFMFNALRKDLKKQNIAYMKPFSNFPFLKQAFSEGQSWKVDTQRLQNLLKAKMITQQQYEEFKKYGAIGSHMENLQRKQGFKGFNQESVSVIISKTDPRKQHHKGA